VSRAAGAVVRCGWCGDVPEYVRYHDEEWGVASHDDTHLFEMLILEGAQAGLSWLTILRKREAYREAFDGFDASRVARYTPARIEKLMRNAGIVRNRAKLEATVKNARATLAVRDEFGSLDAYLWSFVGGAPLENRPRTMADVPAKSAESDRMSKALKQRGFGFVGSTICYAFMQATGMVDDHVAACFRSYGTSRSRA
jgi:DNA-3-methyladenine glycosylase I